ncbi:hypothetical protein V1504DRAFT_462658 [Lipomyces starkeyi]
MVSDFYCPCHGPLQLESAIVRISKEPGVNRDGYWKSDDLVRQLEMAVEVFDKLHPACVVLLCFDQRCNHQALPDDAPTIQKLVLSDRPAREFIRPGWFECEGRIVKQAIIYPDDYPTVSKRGMRKGMRTILEERGMWIEDMKLDYKNKLGQIDSTRQPDCCAIHRPIHRLSQQPGFLSQHSKLENALDATPHLFSMYPFIERNGERRSGWQEMNANIRLQC